VLLDALVGEELAGVAVIAHVLVEPFGKRFGVRVDQCADGSAEVAS